MHLNKLFNCNWDYLLLIVPWAYAGRYLYVFLSGKDGTAKLNFLNMHTAMLCSSTQMHRGHSQNTLTKFCTLLTTYLPLIDIIKWRNSFTVIRGNLYTNVDIFSIPCLPRLPNVVCERPLTICIRKKMCIETRIVESV